MKFNDAGLELIMDFEGCMLTAYRDVGGLLTIGYGHTREVREGQEITFEEALALLHEDLKDTLASVHFTLGRSAFTINDNQFSACVCFAYNVGVGSFAKSTLLNCITKGHLNDAANEFLRWCKVDGKECAGLLRRRKAERDLFLTPLSA